MSYHGIVNSRFAMNFMQLYRQFKSLNTQMLVGEMMFKTIRKNAHKQIYALLSQASVIECTVRSSNYLTDGFDYTTIFVSENELKEWMEDKYEHLVIRLFTRPDGTKQECTFTCDVWSNVTFTIYFDDAYNQLNFTA